MTANRTMSPVATTSCSAAVPEGLPRFCGGLAGYFGYDTVRHIEPRLARTRKSGGIGTPDILLLQCEELAVIDNLADRAEFGVRLALRHALEILPMPLRVSR